MNDRILVPLDGSARAEQILVQVARFLRREDAEVILLGVVDPAVGAGPLEERRSGTAAYLSAANRALAGQGTRVRSLQSEGSAAPEILRAAEDERATLIALSTHGRSGVQRWLLGSVAEKVLRGATVPVLLTRAFPKGPQGVPLPSGPGEIPFRRLLVPVDGSDASLHAIPNAASIAKLFGSEVEVLLVEEPLLPALGVQIPLIPRRAPVPGPDSTAAAEKAASRFRAYDVKACPLTAIGDPSAVILDTAEAHGSDLIVMATHGRSGVSRWALGSVTERVLRHATLPMLVVRART